MAPGLPRRTGSGDPAEVTPDAQRLLQVLPAYASGDGAAFAEALVEVGLNSGQFHGWMARGRPLDHRIAWPPAANGRVADLDVEAPDRYHHHQED